MRQMTALGADWWNDSGSPAELEEAVALGAVGGTSNPVIVAQAAKSNPELCVPLLEELVTSHPHATEDELAWRLIHELGRQCAHKLLPVFEHTSGRKGYLSMQVNPKLYPDAHAMVVQAGTLAALSPNIAIKAPATEVGIAAMEEMTARGIRVNATVSFSVAQVLAVGRALERGLRRAQSAGHDRERLLPYITLMIGRVDDHLKRVAQTENVPVAPGVLDWAGIAVFKHAHQLLRAAGLPGTLLAAAYRHVGHWSEIIGAEVLQTIPYTWWKQFDDSAVSPALTLDEPVDPSVVHELRAKFADFRKAYDEEAMQPPDFVRYGASVHTLQQFIGGYSELLAFVRGVMLR